MKTICPSAPRYCARIVAVASGSPAAKAGIRPGDILREVDCCPVSDYIAYRYAVAEKAVTVAIERDGVVQEYKIRKREDDDLGLTFDSDVFDGVRTCVNHCIFCFEDQMPSDMRPALRLRDDDYRLSFLHGNFLTLTNLTGAEEARILREHLSPLYISVHATDPAIRRALLNNRRAPAILPQLQRLAEGGTELHTQIVLCPGWNDGAVLARTLDDLAALYPAVVSIGIVPVGLTAHRREGDSRFVGTTLRAVTPAEAACTLDLVTSRSREWHRTLGSRLVYAADELYLMAGRQFPSAGAYEGFPQLENGIGISRRFLYALHRLVIPGRATLRGAGSTARRVTIATGVLAAPLLQLLADRLAAAGLEIHVVPVPNRFYGGGVNVAGLLTAGDIRAALADEVIGDALLLPAAMVNADGVTLDDATPAGLAATLGVPVYLCATPAQAAKAAFTAQ